MLVLLGNTGQPRFQQFSHFLSWSEDVLHVQVESCEDFNDTMLRTYNAEAKNDDIKTKRTLGGSFKSK